MVPRLPKRKAERHRASIRSSARPRARKKKRRARSGAWGELGGQLLVLVTCGPSHSLPFYIQSPILSSSALRPSLLYFSYAHCSLCAVAGDSSASTNPHREPRGLGSAVENPHHHHSIIGAPSLQTKTTEVVVASHWGPDFSCRFSCSLSSSLPFLQRSLILSPPTTTSNRHHGGHLSNHL